MLERKAPRAFLMVFSSAETVSISKVLSLQINSVVALGLSFLEKSVEKVAFASVLRGFNHDCCFTLVAVP